LGKKFHGCEYKKTTPPDRPEIGLPMNFKFTKAAEENNVENLLIIHDKKLASLYT